MLASIFNEFRNRFSFKKMSFVEEVSLYLNEIKKCEEERVADFIERRNARIKLAQLEAAFKELLITEACAPGLKRNVPYHGPLVLKRKI